jgi:putative glycolipid-binding protein
MGTRRRILWQGGTARATGLTMVNASGKPAPGLAPGETKTVAAAWVRFPSPEVRRLEQTYECLAERRYRHRSGRLKAVATSGGLG